MFRFFCTCKVHYYFINYIKDRHILEYIKATVVVLLIFALPAGSYLYLRSGFIFRKETLDILKNKTPLEAAQESFIEKYNSTIYDKYYNGVTLFQRIKDEQDQKDLYFLAESLKPRIDFNLVAIADSSTFHFINDTIYNRAITRVQSETKDVETFFNDQRFLLARDSFLRNEYGYAKQDMLDVYEHAVVLLPMKKRDKVKLVRKKEN